MDQHTAQQPNAPSLQHSKTPLLQHSSTPGPAPTHSEDSDTAFYQFLTWVKQRCQLDWSQYRPDYLKRRIEACMAAAGARSLTEYTGVLKRDPAALPRLRDGITVNVTEFFRDAPTFAAFQRTVVPAVAESKRKVGAGLMRVWSAACSSGEEPYSIAMSFLETLGGDMAGLWLSLYATDVDQGSLQRARAGVYSQAALANVPERLVKEFFRRQPEGNFAVGDKLRSLVHFQKLDLLHDEPLKHVDVIFCRYVFIYLSQELQERALRAFHGALNREGFLVLGRTESMPMSLLQELYAPVNPEERIYRKQTRGGRL